MAKVACRASVVTPSESSLVGNALVIELRREPSIEQHPMLAVAEAGVVGRHHLRPDDEGRLSLSWRTSLYTRALVIVLVGGDPGWWLTETNSAIAPAGSVSFDAVSLHELPLRRALARELEGAPESALCRQIAVGADQRRALLCPGSSHWTLPFEWPGGRARVEFSYAIVEEARTNWGKQATLFHATIEMDGREAAAAISIAREEICPGSERQDSGWQEVVGEVELPAGPGKLRFEVGMPAQSFDVAAIAEPRLVPLDRRAEPLSVLLISVDTLRADHLGCYGYRRKDGEAVSPCLDAFAEQCLLFERAYATAPYTLPSHATMFTGRYPSVHGVTDKRRRLVSGIHPLLAEHLAAAGYATAGFTAGGYVSYDYGFDAGFDRYSILDPFLDSDDRFRRNFPHRGQAERNSLLFRSLQWPRRRRLDPRPRPPPQLRLRAQLRRPQLQPSTRVSPSVRRSRLELRGPRQHRPRASRPATSRPRVRTQRGRPARRTGRRPDRSLRRHHRCRRCAARSSARFLADQRSARSDGGGHHFRSRRGVRRARGSGPRSQPLRRDGSTSLCSSAGRGRPRSESARPSTSATSSPLCSMRPASSPTGPGCRCESAFIDRSSRAVCGTRSRSRNQAEIYALQRWPYKLIHTPADSEVIDPDKRLAAPEWQLFDLETDPTEAHELIAERPDDPALDLRSQDLRQQMQAFREELVQEQQALIDDLDVLEGELSDAMKEQLENLGYHVDD